MLRLRRRSSIWKKRLLRGTSGSPGIGRSRRSAGLVVAAAFLVSACSHKVWTPSLVPTGEVAELTSEQDSVLYLKAHLYSGHMILLTVWDRVTDADTVLRGTGVRFDAARQPVDSALFAIPLDSIALVEASSQEVLRPAGLTILPIWTVATGATTAVCVADPKACFGSCPTFYVGEEGGDRPQAEGFSASVARSLEAEDVDMLYGLGASGRRLDVIMRNEALETHVVRSVSLRAVPRSPGTRVFATPSALYHPASRVHEPVSCRATEGDCLAELRAPDGVERRSPADSTDLAARETVELEFPPAAGLLGVVVGARQSFVSTYLFYQTIAYLGQEAGAWLAAMERGGLETAERAMGMARVLGGIEVEVWTEAEGWRSVGSFDEAGPIATDVQVLSFRAGGHAGPVRVRLRMAKGSWRVDRIGLAELEPAVEAVRVQPVRIVPAGGGPLRGEVPGPDGEDSRALARLLHPDQHLVTYPGDAYRLVFELPDPAEQLELFLQSHGYYYEWTRGPWLSQGDPAMAALVLTDPVAALRRLAGSFKQVEPEMERLFWRSRLGGR